MATVTLFPDTQHTPQTVTYDYTFNSRYDSHRAQISLDTLGNYSIRVDGRLNSAYEASAKRSPSYKVGITSLTNQMLSNFNNCDAAYRDIYKHTVQLAIGSFKEREMADVAKKTDTEIEAEADKRVFKPDLTKIELQKYNREKFNVKEPSMTEVEENLHEEAGHRFFSIWKTPSKQKEQFVEENEESVFQDRQDKYNELKSYFETIQDSLALKANDVYLNDYNSRRNSAIHEYNNKRKAFIDDFKNRRSIADDYINGPKSYVDNGIKDLKNRSHLPFKVKLTTKYTQKDGILDVETTIPEIIPIPETKATTLASGRISIKSKLQREKSQDLVLCQLGIAYYLSGFLFNISANIKTIRFSLMATDNGDGYYWVQFSRDQFFTLDFAYIDPLLTMERFPHVIKYGKIALEPIAANDFKSKINDALIIAGQASSSNQTVLSITDAQHILDSMPNATDLRKAIDDAKSRGYSVVVADKKYANILKEL